MYPYVGEGTRQPDSYQQFYPRDRQYQQPSQTAQGTQSPYYQGQYAAAPVYYVPAESGSQPQDRYATSLYSYGGGYPPQTAPTGVAPASAPAGSVTPSQPGTAAAAPPSSTTPGSGVAAAPSSVPSGSANTSNGGASTANPGTQQQQQNAPGQQQGGQRAYTYAYSGDVMMPMMYTAQGQPMQQAQAPGQTPGQPQLLSQAQISGAQHPQAAQQQQISSPHAAQAQNAQQQQRGMLYPPQPMPQYRQQALPAMPLPMSRLPPQGHQGLNGTMIPGHAPPGVPGTPQNHGQVHSGLPPHVQAPPPPHLQGVPGAVVPGAGSQGVRGSNVPVHRATVSTHLSAIPPTMLVTDPTGQTAPPGIKPRVTTTLWEDEGTTCFQVEARGFCVARREDNDMINGTKLLNVAGMTRGRRDGLLKGERNRHVVKAGAMHLKGVWIPYDRALDFANKERIVDLLYPLFVTDIKSVLYHPNSGQDMRQQPAQVTPVQSTPAVQVAGQAQAQAPATSQTPSSVPGVVNPPRSPNDEQTLPPLMSHAKNELDDSYRDRMYYEGERYFA